MDHLKLHFNAIRAAHFYLQHKSLIIHQVASNFVEGEGTAEKPISYVSAFNNVKASRMDTKIHSFLQDHNE